MSFSDEPERLLSVQRVALLFDVKPETIREWIKNGRLNAVKVGRQWRVSISEVKRVGTSKFG